MSKTIYLDGTETLVWAQALFVPGYKPESPLTTVENAAMKLINAAVEHPNQQCVCENTTPFTHSQLRAIESIVRRLLLILTLDRMSEFHCGDHYISLRIYGYRTKGSNPISEPYVFRITP